MVDSEESFLERDNVSVTNTRFVAHGQTYAMSGITSVKSDSEDSSKAGMLVIGGIGVVLLLSGMIKFGLLVTGLAIAAGYWSKPKYTVLLTTAAGESKALTSEDPQFITSVVNALNEAIIYRG